MLLITMRCGRARIAENQLTQGVVLVSTRWQASAASYKARAELLQAQLTRLSARAKLEQMIGRTPGHDTL
jgi:outer membrane protein TolC